jgi:hypothetical protein
MWSASRSTISRLIILIACETIALPAIAMAQPIEPHKVPTETIHAPAANPSPALAPPADNAAVQTLKVQPLPKEGSVPRVGDDRAITDGAAKADAHAIRTVPIGPDTGTSFDADRHFAPRTTAPSQSESK